jgi:hypothetical protein
MAAEGARSQPSAGLAWCIADVARALASRVEIHLDL